MNSPLFRLAQTALLLTALFPALAHAQTAPAPKLDESLREAVDRGCTGTQSVIIRTQPGYREGLSAALTAHGDKVTGEFAALDAVAAVVHCEDLATLAGFGSTNSVSTNARVGVQSVESDALDAARASLIAARASLIAARAGWSASQAAVRSAETVVAQAQAQVGAAQKALNAAKGAAKTAAQVRLTAAQDALKAAQLALSNAKAASMAAQGGQLTAQNNLTAAEDALENAREATIAREREGRSAQRLKRRFFATLPVRIESQSDGEFNNTIGEASSDLRTMLGATVAGSQGSVGVAVIDSGIEPGLDFDGRLTHFYDFTQGDIRATAPSDAYGHGTHVAGLIASEYVGVAPNARLVGLKVLNAKGQGTTANVVRAIEFAIANKAVLDIQVLNLSLGHPIFEPASTDPLVQAVEHAVRSGLVVVLSAGNFGINPKTGLPGYAGIASPGNAPSALTVGATRTFNTVSRDDDRVAPYSSRGPSWYDGFAKPDVVAPGDDLLSVAAAGSTLRLAQEKRGNTGDYMRLSGTSMAAGVASGVVALVLEANRGLTPNALKAALEYSAIPVKDDAGVGYDALTQGAGQLETAGAIALARTINSAAPVGASWLSTALAPSTVIGRTSYVWGQHVIWGNHIAHGQGILTEQRPAWALNTVWGEGLDDTDNIVWGNALDDDNIVWGNSLDEGDNIVWGNSIVWANSLPDDDNIVWGNSLDGGDNIVWGNSLDEGDNIVWGNNVVWGDSLIGLSLEDDNIVWGNTLDDDNIVWGNMVDDNIVWGNLFDDNIVWGNSLDDDNIVWGNSLDDGDNIVWGNSAALGNVMQWSGGVVNAGHSRARRSVSKAGVN